MDQVMVVGAAWVHDLNPFAVRFTPGFGIRWYGLAYVAGFVVAWWMLGRLAKRGLILLKPEAIADAVLFLVIGVMVGGRLGYCLVYRPELMTEFTGSFPFWGVLDLMSGGMASHGGIVGVVVACWAIARANRVPMRHVMDCVACVAPVGIFFGRVANFVNGELLGRIAALPGADGPWWSVRYPQEILERFEASGRTKDQTARLELLLERFARMEETTLAPAADRVIRAIQQGDRALREEIAPLLSSRHPSQVYQAVAEGLVVLAVVWWVWRRPRKPGVVSAAFLVAYGVGRVATEFIRLPDAHFGSAGQIAGLSRGQWLSVGMVAAGVALWVVSARSASALVGGWSGAKRQHADRPVA
jgi:phosphatidylglycerol:prolipoprotein diacylglycerol transferase